MNTGGFPVYVGLSSVSFSSVFKFSVYKPSTFLVNMLSPFKILRVWIYVYVRVYTFLLVTHAGDGVEAADSCVAPSPCGGPLAAQTENASLS